MTAVGSDRIAFLAREYAEFDRAKRQGDTAAAWRHLERAHIVAQPLPLEHMRTHVVMLRFALAARDPREAGGQMLRIVLAVLGNLVGRLPAGNTGRARISAFAPMPVSPDLEQFVEGGQP